jgi:hypothetical protein
VNLDSGPLKLIVLPEEGKDDTKLVFNYYVKGEKIDVPEKVPEKKKEEITKTEEGGIAMLNLILIIVVGVLFISIIVCCCIAIKNKNTLNE